MKLPRTASRPGSQRVGMGFGAGTLWRLLALVAAASRDGSRSDSELDAALHGCASVEIKFARDFQVC
jgi:hypothetical protein